MGPAVTIRGMAEDDLRSVFIFGRELFETNRNEDWNEGSLAALLAECMEYSLVALRGKRMAGFVIPKVSHGTSARIRWLAYRPDEATAVAAPLIEALMKLLSSRRISSLLMAVDAENPQLIDIANKFGFTESKHLLIMEHFFPSD